MKKYLNIQEIESGDVIFLDLHRNEDLLGDLHSSTGTDVILIVDEIDYLSDDTATLFVNGGHEVNIDNSDNIYKLSRYSVILKNIEKYHA